MLIRARLGLTSTSQFETLLRKSMMV